MCSIKNTINEGFMFVFSAEAAAEITDRIAITQGQCVQKPLQLLKTLADFRWI
jgi:hypothetical protein